MEAIIKNQEEELSDTPQEVIDKFLKIWSPTAVRESLFGIFRMAVLGGLEKETGSLSPENVALLFDELVDLVTAVENLYPPLASNNQADVSLNGQEGSIHE